MFCPNCGTQVAESDPFCRFCGRSLSTGKTAPTESAPGRSVAGPTGKPEQPRQRSGEATASVILALCSLIPVAGLLTLWACGFIHRPLSFSVLLHVSIPVYKFLGHLGRALTRALFSLLAAAGLLGVIFGHRARASIRRSGGRFLGSGRATAGLMLGYPGVAGWTAYGIVLPFVIVPYFLTPALERERIRSHQESAIVSLRIIYTGELTYASTYERGYSPSLAVLGPPKGVDPNLPWDEQFKLKNAKASVNAAGLIDEELASGTHSGYEFTYVPGKKIGTNIVTYTVHADPLTPGKTGNTHYFIDESGVVRFASRTQADADCPRIVD